MKKYVGNPESVEELQNIAIEILKPRKKGKLLDAGAGSGRLSQILDQLGYNVRACDIETHHFKPSKIKIDKIDLNKKWLYSNKFFDYVLALELIEHLENPWNFIREAHRVLKPKGILILSSPNVESIRGRFNFLLGRTFPFFTYRRFKEINHINPLFTWNLKRMIENKFKLIEVKYKYHKIPKTNIKIKLKGLLFSEGNFFILERLSE